MQLQHPLTIMLAAGIAKLSDWSKQCKEINVCVNSPLPTQV